MFNLLFGSRPDAFSPFLQFAGGPSVTINLTGNLTVRGNAVITTDSSSFGPAGDIDVRAANILLVGAGLETGRVSAQGGIVGQSGSIRLAAIGKIDLQNGFLVSAGTGGSGNGGIVARAAGESITLGANSRVLSGTSPLQDQELNSFADDSTLTSEMSAAFLSQTMSRCVRLSGSRQPLAISCKSSLSLTKSPWLEIL